MAAEGEVRTFGRYEVLRPLGRGAVGEVFLARDPALGREVAVKTLAGLDALPEGEREEARVRFLREARAAAGLSHPHIVTIHDVGEADGVPFIAMEFLDGTTLDRYTKSGHLLPPPKVLEIGVQAALALDEAHRRGIVHRDIKPANLVLLSDGGLKVADFGLAKGPESGLTARDTILGTPNYMSPEQIAGRDLDGRTDLFSLAVSLFELLAGRRPFGGDTVSSVLYRIVNDPAERLAAANPEMPAALDALLDRALAKDPEKRPATGGDFARELAAILETMGGVPAHLRLPPPGEPGNGAPARTKLGEPPAGSPPAHGRKLYVAVGAALLAAIVWTAPVWGGFDPLGGARKPVEHGLSSLLGPVGRALCVTPSERTVIVETDPPNLELSVSGVGARVAGPGKIVVAADAKGPIAVKAGDDCRAAEASIDPERPPERIRLAAAPRRISARVGSEPAGAAVSVNGEPQGGATPLELTLPACQANTVELTAPGRSRVEVQLGSKEPADAWRLKLAAVKLPAAPAGAGAGEERPATGRAAIPAPPGYRADVLLRGKKVGEAGRPLTLPAGKQTLALVNDEILLRREVSIDVPAGGSAKADVDWPRLGALTIRSAPPGAKVFAVPAGGGAPIEMGATPINQAPVVSGAYEITLEHPTTGKRVTRGETVRPDATTTLKIAQEDWR